MSEVKGYGPRDAKLFFVGEGPGRNEEIKGRPFVGMTGQFVRGIVERAGLDPEEVRWDNAMPVRVKPTPTTLRQHWGHLELELKRVRPIATVACGAAALQRLLGMTGIKETHGGVYPTRSLGIVVPCLHPASVRGKLQAEKMLCERAITRAVKYAIGELKYSPTSPIIVANPSPSVVDAVLSTATVVCVDTEFNPGKRELHLIGFTVDGKTVYSIAGVTRGMRDVLCKHFRRSDLRKIAHYHFADVEALSWVGVDSYPPWFDTLTVFATLYPDLPCGLSHVARFYLDDVADWKHMEKDDPLYNAIDVINTWRVYEHECIDLADAGMWELIEEEVVPVLPLLYGMEARGLQVDRAALLRMRRDARKELKGMTAELVASVGTLFKARTDPLETTINENELAINKLAQDMDRLLGTCTIHEKYKGLRKKKFSKVNDCLCEEVFVSTVGQRTSIAALRLEIRDCTTKLKRWDRGFDPGNNDHVRWLLYDKQALALRVQKNKDTGRATADATAVAKLLSLKTTQRKSGAVAILRSIKRIQKLEKRLSTFLFASKAGRKALDSNAVVHPQYRMRAGTGRPASGSDPYLAEKGTQENKFNVLNIPDEVRRIYVPFE